MRSCSKSRQCGNRPNLAVKCTLVLLVEAALTCVTMISQTSGKIKRSNGWGVALRSQLISHVHWHRPDPVAPVGGPTYLMLHSTCGRFPATRRFSLQYTSSASREIPQSNVSPQGCAHTSDITFQVWFLMLLVCALPSHSVPVSPT